MEFKKADEVKFDIRHQMSRIFTDGFYQWLLYFSKDKERLTRALEHMFILDKFFLAMQGKEVVAITACTDGKISPVRLERKILCKELGFIRGYFAYVMLNKYLVDHKYPFELSEKTGSIEFVATAENHRGKGVAYELINHITNVMPYSEFVLEVADTNVNAVKLYEKLGFSEFKRVKETNNKKSGLNYYIYMKLVPNKQKA